MQKVTDLTHLVHALKFTIFFVFSISASVIVGQSDFSQKMNSSSLSKLSDSPELKLSVEKKNWPPIIPPKSNKQTKKKFSINPSAIIEYDVITKRVSRSNYPEINIESFPFDTTRNSSQSYGSFQAKEQIETVFPPDDRIKISPTVDFPWRTICKLYITFPDGHHFVGSGVLIGRDDGIGFHCLTAGHCVYRNEYGGWAETVEVIPALDNDYTPFYSAWATKIKTNEGWTEGSMSEYDWACITLDRQIGNFTGWMDRFTTSDLNWYKRMLYCAGYPIDLDFGLCLYYNSDSGRVANEYFHWYYMDASDGQSGMPIWAIKGRRRHIVSIHVGDDDGTGSNRGIRLNEEKFLQLNKWVNEDLPPTDLPDLIDDGPKWSNFKQDTVVRGFNQFTVYNDVRNIGTSYSSPVNIAYYASLDPKIESDKDFLIGSKEIASIPPFTWRDAEWSGVFPEQIPSGKYYIGWIIDPADRVVEFNESNNTALITSKKLVVRDPYIMLCRPNGGEVFVIGEENLINWFTAGGSGLVTIDVSYDGSTSWQNLVANLPDTGSYWWNIPLSQVPAFSCLIKVTDPFKNLSDTSNSPFIIETRPSTPGVPQDAGMFSNKTDIKFSWTGAQDTETGISGYQIQIGTSPGANDVADTWIKDELSYIFTGSHNLKLFARVRAKNGVGLKSPWSSSSDGILIDLTAPIIPASPVDQGVFTRNDSVIFQWNSALDEESGIVDYQLQVGTTPGDSNIFNEWVGNVFTKTVIGSIGQTLYARVRAKNGAGSIGNWSGNSDGITIVYPSIITFGENEDDDINGVTFDTYVRNTWTRVNFNYGGAERIVMGKKGDHISRGLIKFDFVPILLDSGVTSPSDIEAVTLSLSVDKGGQGEPQNVDIYRVLKDWGEGIHIHEEATVGEVTWNSAQRFVVDWTEAGVSGVNDREAEFDAMNVVGIYPATYTWDVTNSVRMIFENAENFGWLIKGRNDEEDFQNDIDNVLFFKSKDHSSGTGLPRLIIKYVPSSKPFVATLDTITFGESGEEDFNNVTFDSYIDEGRGDYNMGGSVLLRVGNRGYDRGYRTLIKFDFIDRLVSLGITDGGQIADAWLRLYTFSSEGDDEEDELYVNIFRLKRDWGEGSSDYEAASEGEVTWNSAKHSLANWSTAGADNTIDDHEPIPDDTEFIPGCCGWRTWNVKTTVVKYMLADNENYGWILKAQEEDKDKYYRFYSSEHNTRYRRPQLTIVARIPLEAAAQLNKKNLSNKQSSLSNLPLTFEISQNYPNPFNPKTTIHYQLSDEVKVSLKIYNLIGQEIANLVDGYKPAGYHFVTWNGRNSQGNKVPSGVYLYQFRAGEYSVTKKMVLLE